MVYFELQCITAVLYCTVYPVCIYANHSVNMELGHHRGPRKSHTRGAVFHPLNQTHGSREFKKKKKGSETKGHAFSPKRTTLLCAVNTENPNRSFSFPSALRIICRVQIHIISTFYNISIRQNTAGHTSFIQSQNDEKKHVELCGLHCQQVQSFLVVICVPLNTLKIYLQHV